VRFASCAHDGCRFAALVDGDVVRPLRGIAELGRDTPAEVLADPPLGEERRPLGEVALLPVVPHPGKIICLGLNYREHVAEGAYDVPDFPVLFSKFRETLLAAGEPIMLPPESSAVDYEAELALVVGRTARRASGPTAMDAIAGYTAANDVTMRDYQYRTQQWLPGKNWARSTPLGPFLVTADEVGDPHTLDISLELNGSRMQSANTRQFIFDIPTVIAAISEFVPLEPGDVVLTGTPSGVGYRREPKVLLHDGDRVVVEIERVGRLENPVAAERPVRL
jgi:acylpyruvate hydrolase